MLQRSVEKNSERINNVKMKGKQSIIFSLLGIETSLFKLELYTVCTIINPISHPKCTLNSNESQPPMRNVRSTKIYLWKIKARLI
jgi:hypothetical protein